MKTFATLALLAALVLPAPARATWPMPTTTLPQCPAVCPPAPNIPACPKAPDCKPTLACPAPVVNTSCPPATASCPAPVVSTSCPVPVVHTSCPSCPEPVCPTPVCPSCPDVGSPDGSCVCNAPTIEDIKALLYRFHLEGPCRTIKKKTGSVLKCRKRIYLLIDP